MREFAWSQLDYYSLLPFGGVECRWNGGGLYHIKEAVMGRLDHQNLNEVLHFNPTAENIAHWIVSKYPFVLKLKSVNRKVIL